MVYVTVQRKVVCQCASVQLVFAGKPEVKLVVSKQRTPDQQHCEEGQVLIDAFQVI